MDERREGLKQEIRYSFQGKNAALVWNILVECFDEVCAELGEEKVILKYRKLNLDLPISEVIKDYGIKIKGKLAICPFHNDTNPSLSFSDEKNVFNCFGCGTKGNIYTFVKMMEELKDGNKKRS